MGCGPKEDSMYDIGTRVFTTTPAATLVAGLLASPLLAGPADAGYHSHMNGWGMGLGFGMMILFWGALVVGTVFLVRWLSEQGYGSARKNDALETLKQRLARGEIDIEDYEARRKALES
jgi:putative membrane protein